MYAGKMDKCNNPKCNILKPKGAYACDLHWNKLSLHLRKKIYKGFTSNEVLFQEAHQEAIKQWNNKGANNGR